MIDKAVCWECGAVFNRKKWAIVHKSWCSNAPKNRTAESKEFSKINQEQNDLKWLFIEKWGFVFPHLVRQNKLMPVTEFKFAAEIDREFQFDWCWPDYKIAVEVDGGNRMARVNKFGQAFAVGRHTQSTDYWKRNIAISLGWFVFAFTPEMLIADPFKCCEIVFNKIAEVSNGDNI